jgi:hypothetical protein
MGVCSKSPVYRFIAVREPFNNTGKEFKEENLPFKLYETQGNKYKLFGKVTNKKPPQREDKQKPGLVKALTAEEGEDLIHHYNERCGKSEEAHSMMKTDLCGGRFPSDDFGENACWWWCMILALNLNNAFKMLTLPENWLAKRMKSIRFELINIAGRVLNRSRGIFIRIRKESLELFLEIRLRIKAVARGP